MKMFQNLRKRYRRFRAESKIVRELRKAFQETERATIMRYIMAGYGALIVGCFTLGLLVSYKFQISPGFFIILGTIGFFGSGVVAAMHHNAFICWLLKNEVDE